VILQYHEEIGYQVDYEDFKESTVTPKEIEENENTNILNRVNVMIKEGELDGAISFIKNTTKTHPITDMTLSERYLNLLIMKKRKPEMLKHCITHLDLLAHKNLKNQACELYAKCLAINPKFIPTSFALFKIGGWLNETGKVKDAIKTYKRLTNAFPDDTLVPKAYYRCAQIFHDRLMEPARAKKILSALIQRYPDHEIIPQVKNYLNHLGI
ncbi:MAG: tetratricopeptide repeat protein, partial [Deltaproteobacteria bacterium]|nr:tetratricopeptide repeat protein [Deltaproteobacteria bacterium]